MIYTESEYVCVTYTHTRLFYVYRMSELKKKSFGKVTKKETILLKTDDPACAWTTVGLESFG